MSLYDTEVFLINKYFNLSINFAYSAIQKNKIKFSYFFRFLHRKTVEFCIFFLLCLKEKIKVGHCHWKIILVLIQKQQEKTNDKIFFFEREKLMVLWLWWKCFLMLWTDNRKKNHYKIRIFHLRYARLPTLWLIFMFNFRLDEFFFYY